MGAVQDLVHLVEDQKSAVKKILSPLLSVKLILFLVDSDRYGLDQRVEHVCKGSNDLKQLLVDACYARPPLAMEYL